MRGKSEGSMCPGSARDGGRPWLGSGQALRAEVGRDDGGGATDGAGRLGLLLLQVLGQSAKPHHRRHHHLSPSPSRCPAASSTRSGGLL